MRQLCILTILLIVILFSAIVAKQLYFPALQGQSAYSFLSVFWICGILIVILTNHLIWRRYFKSKQDQAAQRRANRANRRNAFRIIYPAFTRPLLIVEIIDNNPVRHLEFPIIDLSQSGACFLDDGSLGSMQCLSGHIRFHSGQRIAVTGKSIRKIGSQVSVQFQHAIDWLTLLEEQRRVLAHMKSA